MSVKRCTVCNGKKKVAPLGFMQKECPACGAIGFTNEGESEMITSEKLEDETSDMKPIKRRGRPPRKLIE